MILLNIVQCNSRLFKKKNIRRRKKKESKSPISLLIEHAKSIETYHPLQHTQVCKVE